MTRGTPIPDIVTLHVPFRIVKRGARKEMQMPDGATQLGRTDNTLVRALARAFRWKHMLESGEFATIAELADREGIAVSYLARVNRLTLLAPDIIEMILEGRQPSNLTLQSLRGEIPDEWTSQRGSLLPGKQLGLAAAVGQTVASAGRCQANEPPIQRIVN